jgi:hypothetical protein
VIGLAEDEEAFQLVKFVSTRVVSVVAECRRTALVSDDQSTVEIMLSSLIAQRQEQWDQEAVQEAVRNAAARNACSAGGYGERRLCGLG